MQSRRGILGLLSAVVGAAASSGAALAARGDSRATEDELRRPPLLRRRKGTALTATELDGNFQDLHERVLRLEASRWSR